MACSFNDSLHGVHSGNAVKYTCLSSLVAGTVAVGKKVAGTLFASKMVTGKVSKKAISKQTAMGKKESKVAAFRLSAVGM